MRMMFSNNAAKHTRFFKNWNKPGHNIATNCPYPNKRDKNKDSNTSKNESAPAPSVVAPPLGHSATQMLIAAASHQDANSSSDES